MSSPSDSSLRTWRWRASESQLSRICPSSSTCKRRSASWLTAVARILPFEAVHDDLMCLFQNHHKVKTPEWHPSRCVQEHRETAVSVSTGWEGEKHFFHLLVCFCFFQSELRVQNGSRVIALHPDRPPHEHWHYFLMRAQPLKEGKASCSTLKTYHKHNHIILNNTFVVENNRWERYQGFTGQVTVVDCKVYG